MFGFYYNGNYSTKINNDNSNNYDKYMLRKWQLNTFYLYRLNFILSLLFYDLYVC